MTGMVEEKGYWWLPENPQRRYPGKLIFNRSEGTKLELTTENSPPELNQESREYPIIHGMTISGRKVSLLDCFELHSSWGGSGVTTKTLFGHFVFDGFLIPSDGNVKLRSLTAEFPSLYSWLGISGLKVKHENNFQTWDIAYQKPPSITLQVSPSLCIELIPGLTTLPSSHTPKIELNQSVWVSIRVAPALPYRELLHVLWSLENFISFACHKLCTVEEIHVEGDFEPEKEDGSLKYPYARLLYQPVHQVTDSETLQPFEMLIHYSDIRNLLENILRFWIDSSKKLQHVMALYLFSLYGKNNYLDSKFLSIIQSVEVFHRRFRQGFYLNPKTYENGILPKLVASIPTELPPEFRNTIEKRFKYFNEYSLATRLKELVSDHQSLIKEFIPDIKDVIRTIVAVRNHYTHYTGERTPGKENAQETMRCIDSLRLILELSLLKEAGIPEETVRIVAKRNQLYKRMFPRHPIVKSS